MLYESFDSAERQSRKLEGLSRDDRNQVCRGKERNRNLWSLRKSGVLRSCCDGDHDPGDCGSKDSELGKVNKGKMKSKRLPL